MAGKRSRTLKNAGLENNNCNPFEIPRRIMASPRLYLDHRQLYLEHRQASSPPSFRQGSSSRIGNFEESKRLKAPGAPCILLLFHFPIASERTLENARIASGL